MESIYRQSVFRPYPELVNLLLFISPISSTELFYRDIMIHLPRLKSSKGLHSRFLIISAKSCFPFYIFQLLFLYCITSSYLAYSPFLFKYSGQLVISLFVSGYSIFYMLCSFWVYCISSGWLFSLQAFLLFQWFSHSSLCSYSISLFWLSTVLSTSCFCILLHIILRPLPTLCQPKIPNISYEYYLRNHFLRKHTYIYFPYTIDVYTTLSILKTQF